MRGEAVPKGDEGFCKFRVRDAAATIGIEAVEEGTPGGEETPEAAVAEKKRVSDREF